MTWYLKFGNYTVNVTICYGMTLYVVVEMSNHNHTSLYYHRMTSYVVFGTQVPGDGNCMFSSLLEQLKFPEENAKAYGPMYLRREMIVHFIQNKEVLYPFVKEGIKLTYGIVGEKPLSIKQWLSKLSEDKEWGDSICMMLISSLWSVRIGVIRSDSLKLVSYRNKEGIDDQEMLVLYNCSMLKGH